MPPVIANVVSVDPSPIPCAVTSPPGRSMLNRHCTMPVVATIVQSAVSLPTWWPCRSKIPADHVMRSPTGLVAPAGTYVWPVAPICSTTRRTVTPWSRLPSPALAASAAPTTMSAANAADAKINLRMSSSCLGIARTPGLQAILSRVRTAEAANGTAHVEADPAQRGERETDDVRRRTGATDTAARLGRRGEVCCPVDDRERAELRPFQHDRSLAAARAMSGVRPRTWPEPTGGSAVAGVLAVRGDVADAVALVLEGGVVKGRPAAVLALVLRRRPRADLEVIDRVVELDAVDRDRVAGVERAHVDADADDDRVREHRLHLRQRVERRAAGAGDERARAAGDRPRGPEEAVVDVPLLPRVRDDRALGDVLVRLEDE